MTETLALTQNLFRHRGAGPVGRQEIILLLAGLAIPVGQQRAGFRGFPLRPVSSTK